MNFKKLQYIFFASLIVLSISSYLYLNLHVEQNMTPLVELKDSANDSSEKLMADIDAFKHIFRKVANQIMYN